MLSSLVFSLALLVASAVASPTWRLWHGNGNGNGKATCLSNSAVNTLIDGYKYLLQYPQGQDFNATANTLLSDSFFVSSDSINILAGIPLSVNAYPSKQAFIAGQAQTPAIPQLATLAYFYNCDQVAWRWNGSSIGSDKYEVKGIITMDVNAATTQINAVYSEFNSGAWLADIDNPECEKQT